MPDSAANSDLGLRKRRSTRVVQAVPLTVSGVDAAGHQFQERTSTLFISCHGCRYKSKHYVLKNMLVTLEVPHPVLGRPPRKAIARVTWIQRPRTPRELFQIGVELENPGNVWGLAFPPPDWFDCQETDDAEGAAPIPDKQSSSTAAQPTPIAAPAAEDNLHVLPTPPDADFSPVAERHMTRLIVEARQQVQNVVREAASKAVFEEFQSQLVAFNSKLKQANEEWVRTAVDSYNEQVSRQVTAGLDAARQASISAFQEEWKGQAERHLQDAAQELVAHLGEVGESKRAAFDQSFKAVLDNALGRLRGLDTEIDESADSATRRWHELMEGRAKTAMSRLEQLVEAAERLNSDLHATASSMQSSWRERLEADLAVAQTRWHERIESSLEAAAQQSAEQLERQAGTAGRKMADEIESRGAALHAKLERVSVDTENSLATLCTALEGETGRAKVALDELHLAGTRVEESASRLDAMSKSATDELKWYEKKLQSELQTTFEKELEHASNTLREKAAEISGMFASQLEHYSRGYVEHTQVQLDDTVKEALERSRGLLFEAAESAAAEFGNEIRKTVGSEFERLSGSARNVLERAIEEQTPKLRSRVEADAQNFTAEFRRSLSEEVRLRITKAKPEIEALFASLKEELGAEREVQQRETQENRAEAEDQAVEAYKKRLENASNLWLVTTVSMLDQQSKDLIAALARSAEERIRATCTDVLNSFKEAMRQRLQALSTGLAGPPPSTEKK